jgi:hypothetical protein
MPVHRVATVYRDDGESGASIFGCESGKESIQT